MIAETGTVTLITAIIGACCGLLGAVLGIVNTWHQMQKNKIWLKIVPSHAIPVGALAHSNVDFGIEVINLSEFAVTITDVGFLLTDKRKATLATVDCLEFPGKLPVRLEPRTSYKKLFHKSAMNNVDTKIKSAYANTQCGETLTGTSGALKHLTKGAKA